MRRMRSRGGKNERRRGGGEKMLVVPGWVRRNGWFVGRTAAGTPTTPAIRF